MSFQEWKTDNYKFVGKAFDVAYADRMNKLSPIVGEANAKSIDYELNGAGGYGELLPYDGSNLNEGKMLRAFKTILTPAEFSKSIPVRFKEAKIDKLGETKKVGMRLGDSAAMTVYLHILRMFGNAFNANCLGGDGKSWAATDHPVAAKASSGRSYVADPDAGTFSNKLQKVLSVANITEAQGMANRFVTPDGLPFLCTMDTLLVSPELEGEAKKICGDNARLYPDQADHVNPVQDLQYIVIGGGNDGFSAKQWAICDRRIMHEVVNVVFNTRPTVMQSELDNPLIDMYTAYVDFACGWGDARQIIFSTGA